MVQLIQRREEMKEVYSHTVAMIVREDLEMKGEKGYILKRYCGRSMSLVNRLSEN